MMTGQHKSPHWKMFWFGQYWQYVTLEGDNRGYSVIPWIGTTEEISQIALEDWTCCEYASILEDSCIPGELEQYPYHINCIKHRNNESREEERQHIEEKGESYLTHGGWSLNKDQPVANVPNLEKDDLGEWFSNWVAIEGAMVNPAMRTFNFDIDIWKQFK